MPSAPGLPVEFSSACGDWSDNETVDPFMGPTNGTTASSAQDDTWRGSNTHAVTLHQKPTEPRSDRAATILLALLFVILAAVIFFYLLAS